MTLLVLTLDPSTGAQGFEGPVVRASKVQIAAEQMLRIADAPVELVPAPGAGKAIYPIALFAAVRFGTHRYQNVNFDFNDWGGGLISGAQSELSSLMQATSDTVAIVDIPAQSFTSDNAPTGTVDDVPIVLTASSNPDGGPVVAADLADGGSGWAPGDEFAILSSDESARGVVDAVAGGAVTAFHITNPGNPGVAYKTDANPVTCQKTPPESVFFTVNVTAVEPGDGDFTVTTMYAVVDLS